MDKNTLKKIEDKLLDQKEKIEGELKKFASVNPNNKEDFNTKFPQYGDKEDENANEVATYSDNLSIERTLEKELQDIKKAIGRIKKGTYGKCKYCNKNIKKERLLARPASSACVECKKKLTQEK